MDEKLGEPRRFVTIPLYNYDLARDMEKHRFKYSVAVESHFLSNLLVCVDNPFCSDLSPVELSFQKDGICRDEFSEHWQA